MSQLRTLTSSEAKANLGELLDSLAAKGAVEITRHGRAVAVLTSSSQRAPAVARGQISALAALYSSGAISWQRVSDETGAAFGELLLELAKQDLPLPQVIAQKRPAQLALFDAALKQAARR